MFAVFSVDIDYLINHGKVGVAEQINVNSNVCLGSAIYQLAYLQNSNQVLGHKNLQKYSSCAKMWRSDTAEN